MQKSLTWILLASALVAFGFIYFFERRIPGTRERAEAPRLFPEINPGHGETVRVAFASGETLRAEKTNETWMLREPTYPAQQAAIENFLTNIAAIRRLDRIAPHEVALQSAKAFGLEPPRATIGITAGTNRISFQVGARAPLTNNIYLRLQPSGEVVLASSEVVELIPVSADAWRDPRLVDLAGMPFDQLRIRVGPRAFELARNATNKTWRIARPVPARANQERITGLLESLRNAQVNRYVADAPADLERFGLQNAEVELSFLSGTNRLYSMEFGGPLTNEPRLVHARLFGQSNVVAVAREVADMLRQPYKNFHEAQLVSFRPSGLDRVAVESTAKFNLQRESSGRWIAERGTEKLPLDPQLVARFFTNVLALEILDIAKEVPTDVDLKTFGLLPPKASYTFFEQMTNASGLLTNILFTEVSFGVVLADRIYVRRSDEIPVYVARFAEMLALPREPYELRNRRIWNHLATNIFRVTLSNAFGTNSLQRAANGAWSEDSIANEAIGETVIRLAALEAVEWSTKGEQRKAAFGIRENPLTLVLEIKGPNGSSSASVQFGNATMKRNVYATLTLPGENEPVIFEFPGLLFHSLIQFLPIPK